MSELKTYYLNRYGATLSTAQLAEVFGYASPGSVLDAIHRETFPITTRRQGKFRVADVAVVAAYFDNQKQSA